jgi:hypothetical protein
MGVTELKVKKVSLEDDFYVLIVPGDGTGWHDFWLMRRCWCHALHMFGILSDTPEEEMIEIALANGPEYMEDYLEEIEE